MSQGAEEAALEQASETAAEGPVAAAEGLVGIAEACRLTGLSARTVRYYEELGLLPGVRRRSGGRRVYGGDELERLRFITRLKTLGLSLSEIKDLNAVYAIAGSTRDMLNRLDELLGQRMGELDARISELVSLQDEMTAYRQRVERRIEQDSDAEGHEVERREPNQGEAG